MDATHGTIITILVVDDLGEGVPVVWNKEDTVTLSVFWNSSRLN